MDGEQLRRLADEWAGVVTVVTGLLAIVGAAGAVLVFIQRRIEKLEHTITTDLQRMLQTEAEQSLAPMVEARIDAELRAQRATISTMTEEMTRLARDMSASRATIAGLRENREHLAQLHQTMQEIARKAEVGYRYVRYLQHGNTLTRMRIAAKGAEWRREAIRVEAMPAGPDRTGQEAILRTALVEICEPVIANAVVNESEALTPADPGYAGIIDAYARQLGIETQPRPEREQAFHERLTMSCIRKLQEEMYSFVPPMDEETPPDFYTHTVKLCTFAVFGDIITLQRNERLS